MGKKTIIFGAGFIGCQVPIEQFNQEVLYCDNDISKIGRTVRGITIISYENLLEIYHKDEIDKIVIATAKWKDILFQLQSDSISENIINIFNAQTGKVYSCKDTIVYEEEYKNTIYSQDGEEMYLREYFKKSDGFYVDVGAHHPFRFSNTYWAYQRGWSGINIEPNLDLYKEFIFFRKRDININAGVAEEEGKLSYYMFNESALNTFSREDIDDFGSVKEIRDINVLRLDTIFNRNNIQSIDFMDIDVEGLEMSVLRSNDWDKYSPEIVLLEQKMPIEEVLHTDEYRFMKENGYFIESKYNRTVIYRKRKPT